MIEHLTFIHFEKKPDPEKQAELIEKIKAFKVQIPGVIDAQAGKNFSEGYDFGLSVRLENKQSFDVYMDHPKHREVATLLNEMGMSDFSVVDFECS